jgi:hypothetical protein
VAALGEAAELSYQTPLRTPPLWYGTKLAFAGQLTAPAATLGPSHHWVRSADHSSLPVPMPLNISCATGAAPLESPEKVRSPLPLVLCVPHCVP